jgi:hypothetical protein
MNNIWTISINNAALVALRDLGFEKPVKNTVSFNTDTVTLSAIVRDFAADLPLNYDDLVQLYRDGQPWFYGRVTTPNRSADADNESLSFTVSGPWDWLERQTYRQQWQVNEGGAELQKWSTRVIPGQRADGTFGNSGEAVRMVLEFGIALGHPYQIGELEPDSPARCPEMKNLKCAEFIRNLMRLHPDCSGWFDYSTVPPTFHIRRKDSLPAVDLYYGDEGPAGAIQLESIPEITRRDDIAAKHVCISYEVTNTFDGQTYTNIIQDMAPPGTTGLELDCVGDTIPWQGSDTTVQRQPVKARTIMDNDANREQLPTRYYWEYLYPALAGKDARNWKFVEWDIISGIAKDDPAAPVNGDYVYFVRVKTDPRETDEDGEIIPFNPNLHRQLVGGAITDWMEIEQDIVQQEQTLSCFVSVDGGPSFKVVRTITATNAVNRDYVKQDSTGAENPPAGVAEKYLEAVSVVHYQGGITLVEREDSGAVQVGTVVNIAGSRAEWAAMRALVQSVTVDVENGATSFNFGPAAHLSIQDMVERDRLFRGMSGVPASSASGWSQQGKARLNSKPQGNTVDGVKNTPTDTVTTIPKPGSTARHPYQGVDASKEGTPRVFVQLGSHNGIVPTLHGAPLKVDPKDDDNILTLSNSATQVYIQINTNANMNSEDYGHITSAEIKSTDGYVPQNTDSVFYQTLFLVEVKVVDGKATVAVADNVLGSQCFMKCGSEPSFRLV